MRLLVSGSHRVIGADVVGAARGAGHEVVTITARSNTRALGDVLFDPESGWIELDRLEGIDAVVNIGGEGALYRKRWTPAHCREILQSRVARTRTLVAGLVALDPPPKVLVSESWTLGYGDRGEELLRDTSPLGRAFLADVARAWEDAAAAAAQAGIRIVFARYGSVVSQRTGLWAAKLRLGARGLGGRDGSGRQWVSWISPTDAAEATLHLLTASGVEGPVNVTAPAPARNAEVADALASAVGRRTRLPAPTIAWRAFLGRAADETVLASQRVVPGVLEDTGYQWRVPTIDDAIANMIAS